MINLILSSPNQRFAGQNTLFKSVFQGLWLNNCLDSGCSSVEEGAWMSVNYSEWLVTDQRGAFAMGTCEGIRTRKYHGFHMGIVGRSQQAFLLDIDLDCNGVSLWPHCY